MSKLLARLSDPERSGVYRIAHAADVRECLQGSRHDLCEVALPVGKAAMLAGIAQALAFPDWFGGNWDALEDCLQDLSWRRGEAHVIVFSGAQAGEDTGVLLDVLASSAEFWRGRRRAFFALFVDPQSGLALPDLYRPRPGR